MAELASKLPFVHLHPGLSETGSIVVWQLRMPRMVLGGLVGAMLATAGASYQGVFSNPLANPYLLGIASGAGLGATVVIVEGPSSARCRLTPCRWRPLPVLSWLSPPPSPSAAPAPQAGRRRRCSWPEWQWPLFSRPCKRFCSNRALPATSPSFTAGYWAACPRPAGDRWSTVLPYIAVALAVLVGARRLLDVLAVGDEEATSLGVRAERVRLVVIIAATLGTAAAVSVSGLIGFVGIIVPHTIRLLAGPSYRRILPLSVLFGAGFLILADLIARTVISPGEVPLGVVTAFLGAPFFLVILRQSRRLT